MSVGTEPRHSQAVVPQARPADKNLATFVALAAPFDSNEVKSKTRGGRAMRYVTAQTVANRLDDVMGVANWWDEYYAVERGVKCRLTLRLPDGQEISKEGAGGYEEKMSDASDVIKSGYSDALKLAACKFGVGRYLYRCGVPEFAVQAHAQEDAYATPQDRDEEEAEYRERDRNDRAAYDDERAREGGQERGRGDGGEARGGNTRGGQERPRGDRGDSRGGSDRGGSGNRSNGGRSGPSGMPKSGRQLCGWMRGKDKSVSDFVTALLKRENLPWKMIDLADDDAAWVAEQAAAEFGLS